MPRNTFLRPSVTLSILLSVTVAAIFFDLARAETVKDMFREDRAIESLSALWLMVAAGAWVLLGADDRGGRQWHVPVLLAMMGLRELDFDKRFLSEGILQLRLYSGPSPLWEKALGLAVIALVLVCLWRLARISLPRWLAGMRQNAAPSLLAAGAVATLIVAKTIDGLGRKLEPFGVTLDAQLVQRLGRIEEMMEFGAAVLLVQAVVCFARDRGAEALAKLFPQSPPLPRPRWSDRRSDAFPGALAARPESKLSRNA